MGNPWVRRQLPKSHPRVSARVRATKFHILLFLPGDIFDASLLQIGPYWWSRGLESNLHEFSNYRLPQRAPERGPEGVLDAYG